MSNRRPLARSNDGKVIHRASCRHARIRWDWANQRDWYNVVRAIEHLGYRYCKVCDPEPTLEPVNWQRAADGGNR